jgi:hypothetical protein
MNVQATTTRFFEARGEQVLGTWSSRDPVADQHCVDQSLPSALRHQARCFVSAAVSNSIRDGGGRLIDLRLTSIVRR